MFKHLQQIQTFVSQCGRAAPHVGQHQTVLCIQNQQVAAPVHK